MLGNCCKHQDKLFEEKLTIAVNSGECHSMFSVCRFQLDKSLECRPEGRSFRGMNRKKFEFHHEIHGSECPKCGLFQGDTLQNLAKDVDGLLSHVQHEVQLILHFMYPGSWAA